MKVNMAISNTIVSPLNTHLCSTFTDLTKRSFWMFSTPQAENNLHSSGLTQRHRPLQLLTDCVQVSWSSQPPSAHAVYQLLQIVFTEI